MITKRRIGYAFGFTLILVATVQSWAVPIGIVDSGTDIKHPNLAGRVWFKSPDLPDTGFINDINGWNFTENNNKIIDYSYLGKFSPDTRKFFDIQLKILENTATEEERKWIAQKKSDSHFVKELSVFGNFVHGTHVAGIASREAPGAKIMTAKIIPTEVKIPLTFDREIRMSSPLPEEPSSNPMEDLLMKGLLGGLAGQQTQLLASVGQYLAKTKMEVANCSFGTNMLQAKTVVKTLAKPLFKRDLTEEETEYYGKYFMSQILEKGASLVKSSSQTLFVMAAGNDAANNDNSPIYPANLKYENTITVAATRGYERLASFSNYGVKSVEIAAPGVGIESSIPGGDFLKLSGTSQAAPFIAHLAGQIKDINSKLSLKDVKRILMETVDKKAFLADKVAAGGIANEERAIRAAELTLTQNIENAITLAKSEVADVKVNINIVGILDDGDPVPLPSLFQTKN